MAAPATCSYKQLFRITENTSACLIEGHTSIAETVKHFIVRWLGAVTSDAQIPQKTYGSYVRQEVTSCIVRTACVWQAIEQCEHIWIHTYFFGPTLTLYEKMLEDARQNQLNNKVVFNLAERRDTVPWLIEKQLPLFDAMKWLEAHRNIRFVFLEEIIAVIHGRYPACTDLRL